MMSDCINNCPYKDKIDKQDERINRVEGIIIALTEKMDNLAKKMEKFTNVTMGLIVTIVGGLTVTVVGGLLLAILLYILNIGGK